MTLVWVLVGLQGVKRKNKLVLRLMEQLVYPNPAAYRDTLIRFSALNHTSYSEVALLHLNYSVELERLDFSIFLVSHPTCADA